MKKSGARGKNKIKEKTPAYMMHGIKRRWYVNSLSIVVVLLLVGVLGVVLGVASYYTSTVQSNLANRVQTTARFMNRYMSKNFDEFYYNAERLTSEFADKDKLELQIVDSYGRIMFSSSGLAAGIIPETQDVDQSLGGNSLAIFKGKNRLTGERVMSVSSPLYSSTGEIIGTVRCVTSLKNVDKQIAIVFLGGFLVAGLILIFVIVSNRYFVNSIIKPVLKIISITKEIAQGRYGVMIEKENDDEIGELCDTINYMSSELSRVEKVKNDFISSVSHELRTPLTAIGGWSETLLSRGVLDRDEMSQGLSIIHKESRRLTQMVEELLDFSRIESGRLKLHMEVFDLRNELKDAIMVYMELLKKEGIEVNVNIPDDPISVNGDRYRIKQVFLNIIDNASKYGESGKRVDISMDVEEDGTFAVVKIRDYGEGIPAEELPFVKEKFYKGNTKHRGAGIGLAVCDEILRMHSGSLEIESRLNEGTTVIITIPIFLSNPA